MLDILASVDIQLESYDIVAVHRFGKKLTGKNRKVLVRFLNRKNAFLCLKNGKKLRHCTIQNYKNYFITENLCPGNRHAFNKLYKLKKNGEIFNVWSYNGGEEPFFLRPRQAETQGSFYLLNISHDEYICLAEHTAKI